jgi:hypothetical protein
VDSVADRVGEHPWAETSLQYRRINPVSRP